MNKERELELVLEQCEEVVSRKIPLLVLAPEYTKILLDYIKELKEQYCERTDCGGRLGNSKKVEELIKENERLKEENFNLREGIYIEKMSFPSEGRNFKELIEMPTYEELKKENEKLHHYKLLYQKVKERNMEAIEYNKALAKLYDIGSMERSNADTNLLILGDEETIRILKGNNETK